jgi:hypothetical protein
MIPKKFIIYCTTLVLLLGFANHKGYVVASLFSSVQKADKSAPNRSHK